MKSFLFSVLAAWLLMAAPATAQDLSYPGGVTALTRDFDPTNPGKSLTKPVFGDPNVLRQVVFAAWQAARASIADQLIAQMGTANSVGPGITPYNIVCNMGQPGTLSVTPGSYSNGSTMLMKFTVPGNWIEFDTTQPTAAGKWADPRFSCTYDLTLTMALKLGDNLGPLVMTGVTAQLSNSKLDSHGLIADLVFVGNAVTKLFGTDYIKKAQNAINGKQFDFTKKLNDGLVPFNALLSQYGSLANSILNAPNALLPGGLSPRSLPGATPQGPQLLLFFNNDGHTPTRGTGEISGAIRWKKAWGEPVAQTIAPGAVGLGRISFRHPFARGFKIRAIAQSGFAREGMFLPPMTEVGRVAKITLDQADSDAGDSYVLRYNIADLPLGIPIKVEAKMSDVAWKGDVGNQQRIIGPVHWSGVITLKPGVNLQRASMEPGRGIGAVAADGGKSSIGDALRAKMGASRSSGAETSIIIVGGKGASAAAAARPPGLIIPGQKMTMSGGPSTAMKSSDAVALNPQPLPPVANLGSKMMTKRGGILGGMNRQGAFGGIAKNGTGVEATGTLRIDPSLYVLNTAVENPTGTQSVAGIDFEMGLLTGPR